MLLSNYHYILLNYIYIGITTPMSLALSICALLISFKQSVNGAQFSNITPLLFSSCRVAVSICTSVFPSGGPESRSIYKSLLKINLNLALKF